MNESRTGLRTAEKLAGVVAVVAALVVLNGAWVNQHTFQNVAWRVSMAALLLGLAVVVETNVVGVLLEHRHPREGVVVPDFLRATTTSAEASRNERVPAEHAVAGERR